MACEDIGIEPIIVLNKADLLDNIDEEEKAHIEQRLADYQNIGYTVLQVNSSTGEGLKHLRSGLKTMSLLLSDNRVSGNRR